jgi:monothiol glutaredoxin
MSRNLHDEIKNEVQQNKIILYMKGTPEFPRCGFSNAVIQVLNQVGKPFAAVNVLEDPPKWEAVKVFSSWPTIPQLYINGEFVGGCDIALEMHQKGELQPLIEKAFAESGTDG